MAGACRTCRTVPQTTPQRRLLILCDMRNEARASSYKVETAHDPRRDTDIEEGGGNCAWSIDRDVARKRVANPCAQQLERADRSYASRGGSEVVRSGRTRWSPEK